MGYRVSYSKDGKVYMSGARPQTPQEAGDDAASYLKSGATRVEIEHDGNEQGGEPDGE